MLVDMVNVRYPAKQYPPPGVRRRVLGISTRIWLTIPSPVQAELHVTATEESDPVPMEEVVQFRVVKLVKRVVHMVEGGSEHSPYPDS